MRIGDRTVATTHPAVAFSLRFIPCEASSFKRLKVNEAYLGAAVSRILFWRRTEWLILIWYNIMYFNTKMCSYPSRSVEIRSRRMMYFDPPFKEPIMEIVRGHCEPGANDLRTTPRSPKQSGAKVIPSMVVNTPTIHSLCNAPLAKLPHLKDWKLMRLI